MHVPRLRVPLLVSLVVVLIGMLASPSLAATEEEQSNTVQGTLVNTAEDRAPVEGVEITVTSPDGEVFTDTSDDEGKFEIEVPGRGGRVMIELDTETLPDGVSLRNENKSSITRNLNPGQRAVILFPIGPDTRDIATKWDRIPQLVVNGLIFGIILALGALGLSMVFGTTGLTNFAHGELLTLGAMAAYMFNVAMGLPFVLAAVLSVVVGLAVGWAQDRGLWRPLRHRGTGLIAMMIVTIGLQFLLRNLFQYFTSGRTLNYDAYVTPSGVDVGLFSYTYRDAIMAGISAAVIIAVTLALSFTRFGRATRAVADNPALAASTGINVDRVVSGVWIVGTGLAALAGVFLGYTLGVTFNIGQFTLLLLFASVTVGGLGSVWGALIGSLIIGVLIEVSTLVIPAELKNAGALMLLIVILLVRPQGLLGRKERIG
ncbi:branched-chain amino acid ABC transporter permease [Nocardioides donggukensis]|nr:branched-chain amino acid ABC transporter permease [Nocardioides donggukensis]